MHSIQTDLMKQASNDHNWKLVIVDRKSVLRIRIRDPVPFFTPGSGMGTPGWTIRIINISQSLKKLFLRLKYLNSLMRIRNPWWKIHWSGIRIPDPRSATRQKIKIFYSRLQVPVLVYLRISNFRSLHISRERVQLLNSWNLFIFVIFWDHL